jgi:uncharacterized membrane protein YqiK
VSSGPLIVLCVCLGVLSGVVLWRGPRRAREGEALVIERGGAPWRVGLGLGWVCPLLERAWVLDLSVRKLLVERRGPRGLSCRDGTRVDVRATFLVKVARREADILRVAREVGGARANDPEALQGLLEERLGEALAEAVGSFGFEELLADRGLFVDHVRMVVGEELLGFQVERLSLGRLEQTPLDQLDPTNERDAPGIQQLTERSRRLALETAGAPGAPESDEEPPANQD